MPKELYLLIGTVFGALVSLIIVMINNRVQLRLARENHDHQYHLETQKLEYEQQEKHYTWLQERLEDAERMLFKIGIEHSLTGADITREAGISIAQ